MAQRADISNFDSPEKTAHPPIRWFTHRSEEVGRRMKWEGVENRLGSFRSLRKTEKVKPLDHCSHSTIGT
eukprot:3516900-Pyramimonas_sp.AAC.1